jgi:hypothetical protein
MTNANYDPNTATRPMTVNVQALREVLDMLAKAAELASEAGFPPDAFTAAAWQSYVMASPGLSQHIAEAQFMAALDEWRRSGRIASA